MNSQSLTEEQANQRQAYRCPLPEPFPEAALVKPPQRWLVELMDQSATGFAVRVAGNAPVQKDDVVELHTDAGSYEVRVAYVAREMPSCEKQVPDEYQWADEEPTGDADADDARQQHRVWRIGLERRKDLQIRRRGWLRRLHPRALFSSRKTWAAIASLLGGTVAIAGVIAGVLVWYSSASRATPARPRAESPADSMLLQRILDMRHAAPGFVRRPTRNGSGDASSPSAGAKSPAPPQSAARGASTLHDTIRKMPGAEPFALADVVRKLGLNADQQKRIREIVDATEDALWQVAQDPEREGSRRHALERAALLEQARQHALRELTPEQRARWETYQRQVP
jgi:hypothetical protein